MNNLKNNKNHLVLLYKLKRILWSLKSNENIFDIQDKLVFEQSK